jgi:alkanesulfonate monooxygenase SsuD/methylene tetrahydromethanopterin reductase-like flavin-dependent oxidoreductase (luciferase family)
MRCTLFYPVAVGEAGELGTGLLGLDTARYAKAVAELREQMVAADRAGFHSVVFAEHHFEVEGYQVTPNPLLLGAVLAQHTTRLRVGQLGLPLPTWNPLRLAEDIALADHLTGGRLDVGLSRGYQTRSAGTLGQHHHGATAAGTGDESAEALNRRIFEEWFEVLRRAWTEDLWSFAGEFIQVPPPGLAWPHPVTARLGGGVRDGVVEQVAVVPKPLQTPFPPLYTTMSQSPQTLEWAARVGSSVVTLAADPTMLGALIGAYAERSAYWAGTDELRRTDGRFVPCRSLAVAPTRAEALRLAEDTMAFTGDWLAEFGFSEAWRLPGQTGPVPNTVEQLEAAGVLIVGTPDHVGEQLLELRDKFGIEHVAFNAPGGIVENARMLEMIQLFGEEVLPGL